MHHEFGEETDTAAEETKKVTTASETGLLLASRAVTVAVKADVPSAGTEPAGDTTQDEFAASAAILLNTTGAGLPRKSSAAFAEPCTG
jgi:hypothetical protein